MGQNRSKVYAPELTEQERAKAEKRAIYLLANSDMTMGQIGTRVGLTRLEISELNSRKGVRVFANSNNTTWTIGPEWQQGGW